MVDIGLVEHGGEGQWVVIAHHLAREIGGRKTQRGGDRGIALGRHAARALLQRGILSVIAIAGKGAHIVLGQPLALAHGAQESARGLAQLLGLFGHNPLRIGEHGHLPLRRPLMTLVSSRRGKRRFPIPRKALSCRRPFWPAFI